MCASMIGRSFGGAASAGAAELSAARAPPAPSSGAAARPAAAAAPKNVRRLGRWFCIPVSLSRLSVGAMLPTRQKAGQRVFARCQIDFLGSVLLSLDVDG